MKNIRNRQIRLGVAALSRLNVVLLNAVEKNKGKSADIDSLVEECCGYFDLPSKGSLLHQGTFLGFAYVTLVWLWEEVKRSDQKESILKDIGFDFSHIRKICGPRKIETPADKLRVLRNALSHAHVDCEETSFTFADKSNGENDFTKVCVTWSDLGKLSEAFLDASLKHLRKSHNKPDARDGL